MADVLIQINRLNVTIVDILKDSKVIAIEIIFASDHNEETKEIILKIKFIFVENLGNDLVLRELLLKIDWQLLSYNY